uniref:C2 domain-containing protein n=1 Tax=Eptatretus burgeri TaxID=7764 RepID=A0A8C4RA50_EPTBU
MSWESEEDEEEEEETEAESDDHEAEQLCRPRRRASLPGTFCFGDRVLYLGRSASAPFIPGPSTGKDGGNVCTSSIPQFAGVSVFRGTTEHCSISMQTSGLKGLSPSSNSYISGSPGTLSASLHEVPDEFVQEQTSCNKPRPQEDAMVTQQQVETTVAELGALEEAKASAKEDPGVGGCGDNSDGGGCEPEAVVRPAPCPSVEAQFAYSAKMRRLSIMVLGLKNVPPRPAFQERWRVHLALIPGKKLKARRCRTAVQKGERPMFNEALRFNSLDVARLKTSTLRLRLYTAPRLRRPKLLGQHILLLKDLVLEGSVTALSLILTSPRQAATGLSGSGCPQLQLGLSYNPTTGRLSVDVLQGRQLRSISARRHRDNLCCLKHLVGGQVYVLQDMYVKLTLLNSMGQQMVMHKTSVCRGNTDPAFHETFPFQLALFQLSDVTLLVSVFVRRSLRRRRLLGWLLLGATGSGPAQAEHWAQMRTSEGRPICLWHALLEP